MVMIKKVQDAGEPNEDKSNELPDALLDKVAGGAAPPATGQDSGPGARDSTNENQPRAVASGKAPGA
jgi:hypothetical protein